MGSMHSLWRGLLYEIKQVVMHQRGVLIESGDVAQRSWGRHKWVRFIVGLEIPLRDASVQSVGLS